MHVPSTRVLRWRCCGGAEAGTTVHAESPIEYKPVGSSSPLLGVLPLSLVTIIIFGRFLGFLFLLDSFLGFLATGFTGIGTSTGL